MNSRQPLEILNEFKFMVRSSSPDVLEKLCEQFVYDHEGAINAVMGFAANYDLSLTQDQVKELITLMHKEGDFDHVKCWGLPLGSNDLCRKFYPR